MMSVRNCFLSLALSASFLFNAAGALDLDINREDSIKAAAKSLASDILVSYSAREDSVPGVFPEPYFWWEAGLIWNTFVEYSYLTGDSQHDDLVSEALQHQVGEGRNFMPVNQTTTLGNDDQSTWALAALTAAEVGFPKPEEGEWVDLAQAVFDTQTLRWDDQTCGGGLKWQIFPFNRGYNYKNTRTNAMFFLLSARLAQFTGNQTFADWAEKAFTWTQDVGFMTENYTLFDGADDTENCSDVTHVQWSDDLGLFMDGAAIMYNLTDGGDQWKDAVTGFVDNSDVFLRNDSSVLYEVACEDRGTCYIDQMAFKGITARSFARAAISAPFVADSLNKVLEASAEAAAQSCNDACSSAWGGEDADADVPSMKEGGLSTTFAAMETIQALLYSRAGGLTTGGADNSSSGGNSTESPNESGSPTDEPQPGATGAAGRVGIAWGLALLVAFVAL